MMPRRSCWRVPARRRGAARARRARRAAGRRLHGAGRHPDADGVRWPSPSRSTGRRRDRARRPPPRRRALRLDDRRSSGWWPRWPPSRRRATSRGAWPGASTRSFTCSSSPCCSPSPPTTSGFMWVAIEGTTLASVFLVNFERTRASLEASYKYLLICSVGIAVAFVGTVLVYFADVQPVRRRGVTRCAGRRCCAWPRGWPPPVVELAFVFLARGLRHQGRAGADAHVAARRPQRGAGAGERADVRRAARRRRLRHPAIQARRGPRGRPRLHVGGSSSGLGLLSMAVAAAFLWSPTNYKRMLAYSSVEHVGIVCLGLGFGGPWGIAGALLHIANHALAKSALFLLAGRIRAAYGSAEITAVRGLLHRAAAHGRGVPGGDAGPHGPAALRALHQRGHDHRRRLRQAARSWRPRSGSCSCSSPSAGCSARPTGHALRRAERAGAGRRAGRLAGGAGRRSPCCC